MIPNSRAFSGNNTFEQDGRTYYRTYVFEKAADYRLRFRFVTINSRYEQGIAISFSKKPKFKGTVRLAGKSMEPHMKGGIPRTYSVPVIAAGDCPEHEFEMEVKMEAGNFCIANASDILPDFPTVSDHLDALAAKWAEKTGKSAEEYPRHSFVSGISSVNPGHSNAFWLEAISENCLRFHCNDHEADDDFDDMVFDMEVEEVRDSQPV